MSIHMSIHMSTCMSTPMSIRSEIIDIFLQPSSTDLPSLLLLLGDLALVYPHLLPQNLTRHNIISYNSIRYNNSDLNSFSPTCAPSRSHGWRESGRNGLEPLGHQPSPPPDGSVPDGPTARWLSANRSVPTAIANSAVEQSLQWPVASISAMAHGEAAKKSYDRRVERKGATTLIHAYTSADGDGNGDMYVANTCLHTCLHT